MSNLLELRSVTKVFGGGLFKRASRTVAVEDVSFAIDAEHASITAVAGESGSGKTTLARLLLGVIRPTAGEVIYDGNDVAQMSGAQRRQFRREVQPIFQDPFEVYNPFYKADHLLHVAIEKFRLAYVATLVLREQRMTYGSSLVLSSSGVHSLRTYPNVTFVSR